MRNIKEVNGSKIEMLDKGIDDMEAGRELELEEAYKLLDELKEIINNVPDVYEGFVVAVLNYVKKKPSRLRNVKRFLDNNPSARTSDVLEFISNQDDFYEDAAYDDTVKEE